MHPPPWWNTQLSHAPDAAAYPPPTHQRQQEPQQTLQAKAEVLPPYQQPRPPPLPAHHATSLTGSESQSIFEIKGTVAPRFHPFAKQFGKVIRDEMTRLYNEDKDPEQARAKALWRPVISAIRRATGDGTTCDKWITTGRCKGRFCSHEHPD